VTHANQLLEKENSGCHALLRDDKVLDSFALVCLMMVSQFMFALDFLQLKNQMFPSPCHHIWGHFYYSKLMTRDPQYNMYTHTHIPASNCKK